jgi:multidrug efflux system membrane fusion protein
MPTKSRKTSVLIACGVAGLLALWMLSGIGGGPQATAPERTIGASAVGGGERGMRVSIIHSAAARLPHEVTASARTEPNRFVELKSETDGRVIEIGADRGSPIQSGGLVARLDLRDRRALLEEVDALIVQTQLQYEAAQRLQGQQFISETQIAEARAKLVSAQTGRDRIMLDIERTTIGAPFDALIQDRFVEIGDYVKLGDRIAQMVDTDPIIIVGDVNERDVTNLRPGMAGRASVGDQLYTGIIRYLAPVATASTRTFRVELAVANPEQKLRAGMTAQLVMQAGEITAHTLSAGLLTLADDGTIGVKAVDEFDTVRFYPVELVGSDDNGVVVTGLPDRLDIISVGQGFVIDGQAVTPVEDDSALRRSDDERPH